MILDKPQMGSGKHQVDGGDSVAEMTPPWSFDAFGFHHRDVHHLSATSKFRGRRWLPRWILEGDGGRVQRCPEMSTESTSIWVYLIIVDYRWLSTWHYIFTTCKESRSIKWPAMNPGPPHLQREPHLRRRLQRCQTHRQGRHCPSPPLLIRALVSQQTQRKIISTRLPWSWKMLILWTAQEWRNPSKRHTCWLESHPCSRCQRVSLKPMVRTKQC